MRRLKGLRSRLFRLLLRALLGRFLAWLSLSLILLSAGTAACAALSLGASAQAGLALAALSALPAFLLWPPEEGLLRRGLRRMDPGSVFEAYLEAPPGPARELLGALADHRSGKLAEEPIERARPSRGLVLLMAVAALSFAALQASTRAPMPLAQPPARRKGPSPLPARAPGTRPPGAARKGPRMPRAQAMPRTAAPMAPREREGARRLGGVPRRRIPSPYQSLAKRALPRTRAPRLNRSPGAKAIPRGRAMRKAPDRRPRGTRYPAPARARAARPTGTRRQPGDAATSPAALRGSRAPSPIIRPGSSGPTRRGRAGAWRRAASWAWANSARCRGAISSPSP
jgi:hypothetical protein